MPDQLSRYAWWHSVAWITGAHVPTLGEIEFPMSGDVRGKVEAVGVLWDHA